MFSKFLRRFTNFFHRIFGGTSNGFSGIRKGFGGLKYAFLPFCFSPFKTDSISNLDSISNSATSDLCDPSNPLGYFHPASPLNILDNDISDFGLDSMNSDSNLFFGSDSIFDSFSSFDSGFDFGFDSFSGFDLSGGFDNY